MPAISDRSETRPRRHVAATPATKLASDASTIDTPMRSNVQGRWARRRLDTGRFRAIEYPRSPRVSRPR